jgi:hypothetical protein
MKLVQKELLETQSSLRGILRGFGLKVGKTTPVGFEGSVRGNRLQRPDFKNGDGSVRAVLYEASHLIIMHLRHRCQRQRRPGRQGFERTNGADRLVD